VERVAYGHYRLPSTTRPGQCWTVRVVDGRFVCDCEAGRSGRPCCHAAAVFVRKTECAGARVTGPAARRPVVTVDDEGRDDYCGEDDLTEAAIEARNDLWASMDDPRAEVAL
jgi:hypothetical protein